MKFIPVSPTRCSCRQDVCPALTKGWQHRYQCGHSEILIPTACNALCLCVCVRSPAAGDAGVRVWGPLSSACWTCMLCYVMTTLLHCYTLVTPCNALVTPCNALATLPLSPAWLQVTQVFESGTLLCYVMTTLLHCNALVTPCNALVTLSLYIYIYIYICVCVCVPSLAAGDAGVRVRGRGVRSAGPTVLRHDDLVTPLHPGYTL